MMPDIVLKIFGGWAIHILFFGLFMLLFTDGEFEEDLFGIKVIDSANPTNMFFAFFLVPGLIVIVPLFKYILIPLFNFIPGMIVKSKQKKTNRYNDIESKYLNLVSKRGY